MKALANASKKETTPWPDKFYLCATKSHGISKYALTKA